MGAVLPFPPRHKGRRVRRRTGMQAAGDLSLLLLEREGEAVPANVARFALPHGPETPDRSPALLLAVAMFSHLSADQRAEVRAAVRCLAYGGDNVAASLHELLRPGRTPEAPP